MIVLLSAIVLIIWLGLLALPGRFWQIETHVRPPEPASWPAVIAVIPARNEVPLIGETLRSLWQQEYPGGLKIVLVDDQSSDGTEPAALDAAAVAGHQHELEIVHGSPPPEGWAGKVWAMHQGLERATIIGAAPYILFSDADISHGPHSLRELVARAESDGCDLVSLMVRLRTDTSAEKLMIPAFVFFFRMLYPFRRINDPSDALAGAAGGTMLVRREALERIGGLTAIRDALIDDCSLAREIKRGGRKIWLGLSRESRSTRGYGSIGEIVRMISRTAYTQLGYSPLRLIGCVAGLCVTFLAPPFLTLGSRGPSSLLAGAAWVAMCGLYAPMLRFYGRSLVWAPTLPLTATIYLYATILSAVRHHCGVGGEWKGRVRKK